MTSAGKTRSARRAEAQADWADLSLIGHCVSGCAEGERRGLAETPGEWERLVALASEQMVAPALGWCLEGADGIPAPVAHVFGALFELNDERNRRVLTTLVRATHALNAVGIQPLLLKGAAMLAAGDYPAPGLRVLLDCDLMVPPDQAQSAFAALESVGFYAHNEPSPGHHHLPMQRDPETSVSVELHHAAARPNFVRMVDRAGALAQATEVGVGGGIALIPGANWRVAHNIVHSQIVDRRHRAARPSLRQLLDLSVLRRRHGTAIDWVWQSRHFARFGFAAVLRDNLALAEALLGEPAPAGSTADAQAARQRFLDAAARGKIDARIRKAAWRIGDAARDLRHDPATIVAWLKTPAKLRRLFR